MKYFAFALTCLLILWSVKGCKKDESSSVKSSLPGSNETQFTLRFGSLEKEFYYKQGLTSIELELENIGQYESCIVPWYYTSVKNNAKIYIRPEGSKSEWIFYGDTHSPQRTWEPPAYKMIIPSVGKLRFWITISLGRNTVKHPNKPPNFKVVPEHYPPGKYEVKAGLVQYPKVVSETCVIQLVEEDPRPPMGEPNFSSFTEIIEMQRVRRGYNPFTFKFHSLEKEYKQGIHKINLELENTYKVEDDKITPWYFANDCNSALLFFREAGSNDRWIKCIDIHSLSNIQPTVTYERYVPPGGKFIFPIDISFERFQGEYEIYACLSAMPKVKTETRIIQVEEK